MLEMHMATATTWTAKSSTDSRKTPELQTEPSEGVKPQPAMVQNYFLELNYVPPTGAPSCQKRASAW